MTDKTEQHGTSTDSDSQLPLIPNHPQTATSTATSTRRHVRSGWAVALLTLIIFAGGAIGIELLWIQTKRLSQVEARALEDRVRAQEQITTLQERVDAAETDAFDARELVQQAQESAAHRVSLMRRIHAQLARAQQLRGQAHADASGRQAFIAEALAVLQEAESLIQRNLADPDFPTEIRGMIDLLTELRKADQLLTDWEDARLEWTLGNSAFNARYANFNSNPYARHVASLLEQVGLGTIARDESAAREWFQQLPETLQVDLIEHLEDAYLHEGTNAPDWLARLMRQLTSSSWHKRRQRLIGQSRADILALTSDKRALQPSSALFLARLLLMQEPPDTREAIDLLRQSHRVHPDEFWTNVWLGKLISRHQPQDAIPYAMAAIAIRPHPILLTFLGELRFREGDSVEAAKLFRRAIQLGPDNAAAYHHLGNALERQGDRERAVAYFRKAMELAPERSTTRTRVGTVLADLGELDEALEQLQTAVELDSQSAEARTRLGDVLHRHNRLEEALAQLRASIELAPRVAESHYLAGIVLQKQGHADSSLAALARATELDAEHVDGWFELARLHFTLGTLDESFDAAQTVVELDSTHSAAHRLLGEIHMHRGRLSEAELSLRKAIELDENESRNHAQLGCLLTQQSRLDDAHQALATALDLDANLPLTHAGMAITWARRGNVDQAIRSANTALNLDPHDGFIHFASGFVFTEQSMLAQAEDAYRRALALQPYQALFHYSLSDILRRQGRLVDAINAARQAVKLQQPSAEAHYYLGRALLSSAIVNEEPEQLREATDALQLSTNRAPANQLYAHWLDRATRINRIQNIIPDVVYWSRKPVNQEERIDLAIYFAEKRDFARAAAYFVESISDETRSMRSMEPAFRFEAARCAALAIPSAESEEGIGEQQPDRIRQLAFTMLESVAESRLRQLNGENVSRRHEARRTLNRWLRDKDLATVRDSAYLDALSDKERERLNRFWTRVRNAISTEEQTT